jgi:OmpA-OmpF porin, OOP family
MKTVICGMLLLAASGIWAQSEEHKWNIGVHGGAYNYNGDLGNGFYNFNQAYYGLGGLSVSRYLSRHFDATLFGTRGEAGYVKTLETWVPDDGTPRNFLIRFTTVNAMLRYFPLGRTRFVQPYLAGGLGVTQKRAMNGTNYNSSPVDYALPTLAAGLQFPLGGIIAVQLQETIIHSSTDKVDRLDEGMNDLFLLHSIGLTFNLAKFWDKSEFGNGNSKGLEVDKCPKMPKEMRSKSRQKQEGKTTKRSGRKSRSNNKPAH